MDDIEGEFEDQATDLYGNALEGDDDFLGVIDDISEEDDILNEEDHAPEVL